MNVHRFGKGAKEYIESHGGTVEQRDTNAYNVEVPQEGFLAIGGYRYHRGDCTLYAYEDGTVLDFTVETGDHSLTMKNYKSAEEAKKAIGR